MLADKQTRRLATSTLCPPNSYKFNIKICMQMAKILISFSPFKCSHHAHMRDYVGIFPFLNGIVWNCFQTAKSSDSHSDETHKNCCDRRINLVFFAFRAFQGFSYWNFNSHWAVASHQSPANKVWNYYYFFIIIQRWLSPSVCPAVAVCIIYSISNHVSSNHVNWISLSFRSTVHCITDFYIEYCMKQRCSSTLRC